MIQLRGGGGVAKDANCINLADFSTRLSFSASARCILPSDIFGQTGKRFVPAFVCLSAQFDVDIWLQLLSSSIGELLASVIGLDTAVCTADSLAPPSLISTQRLGWWGFSCNGCPQRSRSTVSQPHISWMTPVGLLFLYTSPILIELRLKVKFD